MKKFYSIFLSIMIIFSSVGAWAAEYTQIDTVEAGKLLRKDGVTFVDTRSPDAFNGWALKGEKRGGHIPLATNLSASWITRALKRTSAVTASKALDKAAMVVVYGDDAKENTIVADYLVKAGVKPEAIRIYKDNYKTWAAGELPVSHLRHYENIVPASWLKEQLDSNKAIVIEAAWGKGKKFNEAHIPGAVHLNTDLLESEKMNWNLLPDSEIVANLLKHGVTADKTVVVYGEVGIDAARAAVAMMKVGVRDVRMLNGGLNAWRSAGYPLESGAVTPVPAKNFGNAQPRENLVINTPEAKRILKDPNAELVSIRSWPEYVGETSGYSYIKPKGRIPGAVWGHCGSDAYNVDDFRNPDNTMRDYHEIEHIWAQWGITPDKEVSFYCGTGWRAAETLFYALAMGFDKATLYDDGWFIWSMDPKNPIATGDPK
jgi:thiosulfate/3-mercaptopyruvate sulfurtransferase